MTEKKAPVLLLAGGSDVGRHCGSARAGPVLRARTLRTRLPAFLPSLQTVFAFSVLFVLAALIRL
jgi:hypothetical protein